MYIWVGGLLEGRKHFMRSCEKFSENQWVRKWIFGFYAEYMRRRVVKVQLSVRESWTFAFQEFPFWSAKVELLGAIFIIFRVKTGTFCMIMQKLLYVYSKTSVFRVKIFRVKSLHFNICGKGRNGWRKVKWWQSIRVTSNGLEVGKMSLSPPKNRIKVSVLCKIRDILSLTMDNFSRTRKKLLEDSEINTIFDASFLAKQRLLFT